MVSETLRRAAARCHGFFCPEYPRGWALHISDTPACTFGFLRRLIHRAAPALIVHTGDLVDNVKLELRPGDADLYARHLAVLLPLLESSGAEIHLVLGNHDRESLVRDLAHRATVHPEAVSLVWGSLRLRAAHRPEDAREDGAAFCLFGHDRSQPSVFDPPVRLLNGLEHAHLIAPEGDRILRIPWPWGTEDARLLRRRCRM